VNHGVHDLAAPFKQLNGNPLWLVLAAFTKVFSMVPLPLFKFAALFVRHISKYGAVSPYLMELRDPEADAD